MAWRVWSKSNFTLSTILVAGILTGCNFLPSNQTDEVTRPSLEVPAGGRLMASRHTVWVVDAQGESGRPYEFTAEVKGVLIQPASSNALVFLEENGTWTIWSVGAQAAELVYSTKAPLSQCSLAPNGHALACIQVGDLNLIQLSDGSVERIDTGVVGVTWSPTNSDLLVQLSDRVDFVGLDLTDHVASRTLLLSETGDHPQFINSEQVIWWQSSAEERQLVLFSLRTQEKSQVWAGQAGAQSWVSSKGNRIVFSTQDSCVPSCAAQVVSLPQGQLLQTHEGQLAGGWLQQAVVVKTPLTPIDQASGQTYHFATLTESSEESLGDALFLATDTHLEIEFFH
ncbi:MAG: hypothetical protein AAB558_04750 [Patescibacteria group bacterium]